MEKNEKSTWEKDFIDFLNVDPGAVPPGADLSPFAAGETATMYCRFHDGHFVLAGLKTEHASLVLEP